MPLQSVLEQALGRRKAAGARALDETKMRFASEGARANMARESAAQRGLAFTTKLREDEARKGFLAEREDRRASAPQPFSLVGKDFFGAMGRAEDEAAWEGKTFNLGGMQEGRPEVPDVFSPLRQRMKTVEERQAEAFESGDRANLSRRRDESLYQANRGAEMRNDVLGTQRDAAVFDPHGDNEFGREMERAGTKGTFDRTQADLGFQQKLRQYFDPSHQSMLTDVARRESEPRLAAERIKGEYDLAGKQATAFGNVEEARTDLLGRPQPGEKLLENDDFVSRVIEALAADPETMTPQQRQMLSLFNQTMTRGGGQQPQQGGKEITAAELNEFAQRKGWTPQQARQYAADKGYAVR